MSSYEDHSEYLLDNYDAENNIAQSNADVSSNDIMWQEKMEDDLGSKVARLSIKHRLTHTATNSFFALLRDLGHEVPADARTILGTTRNK